jgi:hypothetical protein
MLAPTLAPRGPVTAGTSARCPNAAAITSERTHVVRAPASAAAWLLPVCNRSLVQLALTWNRDTERSRP